jgi:DNA-binding transcriptional LysR family regulator
VATIDLNHVATFVRVVEAGSFTKAAKALGVPLSKVSRAVARLEDELGVRLLHRTTRRIQLSDPGRHFFERMQTVITETEAATSAVTGFAKEVRGLVRITAPIGLAADHLPQIVGKILKRYPGIAIELRMTNRFVDLVAEGYDLAVRGGVLNDSSLIVRKVADSELGIFASPAYVKRHGELRKPSDLLGRDCLSYGSREAKLPWRLRGPRGEQSVNVTSPVVCDDMLFLRECAAAGLGLALIPLETAAPAVAERRLVRVLPQYGVVGGAIHLVWPSQRLVPARVVAVRELLAEELARLRA